MKIFHFSLYFCNLFISWLVNESRALKFVFLSKYVLPSCNLQLRYVSVQLQLQVHFLYKYTCLHLWRDEKVLGFLLLYKTF